MQRLLIAGIHEGAVAALRAKIGVADRWAALLGVEAVGEQGVGAELGRAAMELPLVAEHHAGAAPHRRHNPANLHVRAAELPEIANGFPILRQADHREQALLVGRLGRADVEESGAVVQLNHIVDVG